MALSRRSEGEGRLAVRVVIHAGIFPVARAGMSKTPRCHLEAPQLRRGERERDTVEHPSIHA
jgi:hypothetical protein